MSFFFVYNKRQITQWLEGRNCCCFSQSAMKRIFQFDWLQEREEFLAVKEKGGCS